MPRRVVVIMIVAVAVIIAIALITGLGREPIDVDEVRTYADPITEGMLVAMNDEDYTAFSEHFSDNMREAMPEEVFEEVIVGRIRETIGEFVSKDFLTAERQAGGILVAYTAEFTDEPDGVIVRVFFREIDGDMRVSGIWFDSAKLRQLN